MAKRKKVFRPLTALLFASAVVVAAASAAFAQVAVTAVAVADLGVVAMAGPEAAALAVILVAAWLRAELEARGLRLPSAQAPWAHSHREDVQWLKPAFGTERSGAETITTTGTSSSSEADSVTTRLTTTTIRPAITSAFSSIIIGSSGATARRHTSTPIDDVGTCALPHNLCGAENEACGGSSNPPPRALAVLCGAARNSARLFCAAASKRDGANLPFFKMGNRNQLI